MCGVYMIRHVASGKVYVGSSLRVYGRWESHVRDLTHGAHGNRYLQFAWTKHGSDAFEFVILETCLPDDRIAREQVYIDQFRAADRAYGYNINVSAFGLDGAARRKLAASVSKARAGKKFGPRDPAIGQKIAASLRGQPMSEERKRKIGDANRGKLKGIPKSAEHRAKIATASAKHRHSDTVKARMRESKLKLFASKDGAEVRLRMSTAKTKFYQTAQGVAARERLREAAKAQHAAKHSQLIH